MRFDYYTAKTREQAEKMLDHLYACGEIDESDYAKIEHRGARWFITLAG
jgi:uncharacterized membrane protein